MLMVTTTTHTARSRARVRATLDRGTVCVAGANAADVHLFAAGAACKRPASVRMTSAATMLLALLVLAVLLLAAAPGAAWARGAIDVDATCELAVANAPADESGGAAFSLYRVAAVNEVGDAYTPCADFADYAVNLMPENDGDWRALAQTLSAYAARDGVSPVATGVADASGALSFSGLETGLYLLVGAPYVSEGVTFSTDPLLIQLPDLVEAADSTSGSDEWVYNAKAVLKSGTDVLSSVSALKVWADNDAATRPASVDVQLLCDGEVYASAALSSDNNWRVTWDDLDPTCVWQVVESTVPEGYTSLVSCEGGLFTVTNTAQTALPVTGGDSTDAGSGTTLPQTGQLWWPVCVLAVAGLALVLAGLARRYARGAA